MNGELYPGEFDAMERQGRLDAVMPEQKMMTREEAITNLEMIRVAFVEPITKEQRKLIDDTFDMAIKALEQDCDTCEVGNPCLYCKHEFEPQESEDRCIKCANNGMIDDECAYCTNHNLFKAESKEQA